MIKNLLENIDAKGKIVFNRSDLNVPLKNGVITDDTRIKASLPTLKYLMGAGAKVICVSHLGRPKGQINPEFTLKPIAQRLSELLNTDVKFCESTVGPDVEQVKSNLQEGELCLLENLRFNPGETQNDSTFAQELAQGIDIYVNDAFGTCHRKHASMDKISGFVPQVCGGFLLKKEIEFLSMAIENPPVQYVAILGGAKVSDKIPVIANLIGKANTILIGGAMAYTFLKATGMDIGKSKVEDEYLPMCKDILKQAEEKGIKLLLPIDHIAATRIEPNITVKMTRQGESIPPEMMGLDIGYDTIELYINEIKGAELIVWNGPMGVFEIDTFSAGTSELAKAVASSDATSIIGGGDLISAINKAGVADQITHISTGGGASLEFLSGKKLPGLEAL